MAESGLLSAGGPLRLNQAVPGNLSTGPCGPGGAPYGRTEYGRSRRSRGRSPGVVKGLMFVQGCVRQTSSRAKEHEQLGLKKVKWHSALDVSGVKKTA